jgi:hypothetical protein
VVRTRASLHPDLAGRQSAEEPLDLVPPELSPGNDPPSGVGGVNLKDGLRDVEADEGNLMSHGVLPCQLKLRIVPQRRGPGERGHPCHHGRRKLFKLAEVARAPLAVAAVERIDAIFDAERALNGLSADRRRAARQEHVAPLVAGLEAWMRTERARLSRHAEVAKAMDYMLKRRDAFARFLDDGRICLTNNAAERSLRGVALGRKAWLFAGSPRGGARAAAIYSLIVTAKLNDVDPRAWLADVLARIADHPARRLHDLLPWNWTPPRALNVAA